SHFWGWLAARKWRSKATAAAPRREGRLRAISQERRNVWERGSGAPLPTHPSDRPPRIFRFRIGEYFSAENPQRAARALLRTGISMLVYNRLERCSGRVFYVWRRIDQPRLRRNRLNSLQGILRRIYFRRR